MRELSETARAVEALLFLSPEPLARDTLMELTETDLDAVTSALSELDARHGPGAGLEIAEVAGGWVLRTRPDLEMVCDRLRQRPPEDRLSPAALETLAVVAYLEPISRPDIGRVRGVSVDSTVANLVERGLLEESGRQEGTGAMRYRTTRAFQQRFGLRDQKDLPPLDRFELTGPQAEELRRRLVESGHLGPSSPAAVIAMAEHREGAGAEEPQTPEDPPPDGSEPDRGDA